MSVVKVAHVFKRMEKIDRNIEELLHIETSLPKNREYYEALYISIEKEINHLLDEKIKLVDLKIENPPASLLPENQGIDDDPEPDYVHPFSAYPPSYVEPKKSEEKKNPQPQKLEGADVASSASASATESPIAQKQEKPKDDVSSLEKFARSLDLGAQAEKAEKPVEGASKSKDEKDNLSSSLKKSRQDILNSLSQVDF